MAIAEATPGKNDQTFNPVKALVSPERFFLEIPPLWSIVIPLGVIAMVKIAVNHWMLPYLQRGILLLIPPQQRSNITPEYLEQLLYYPVQDAGVVLLSAIFCLFFAGMMFISLETLGRQCAYRDLVIVTAFASLAFVGKDIYKFIILRTRGVESIYVPQDLQPAMGLGLFYGGDSTVLRTALEAANVFDCWFLIVICVGVKTAFDFPLRPVLIAALGSWSLVQVLRISLERLAQGMAG